MWLWYEKDYFSFDDGYRVEGFAAFEEEPQFARVAESLARRAAEEVKRYRSRYPALHAAATRLAANARGFWDSFHAGVACGLAGNKVDARRFFEAVTATDEDPDWARAAATLAREYGAGLDDPAGFQCEIKEVILRTRGLLRLEAVADIRFDDER